MTYRSQPRDVESRHGRQPSDASARPIAFGDNTGRTSSSAAHAAYMRARSRLVNRPDSPAANAATASTDGPRAGAIWRAEVGSESVTVRRAPHAGQGRSIPHDISDPSYIRQASLGLNNPSRPPKAATATVPALISPGRDTCDRQSQPNRKAPPVTGDRFSHIDPPYARGYVHTGESTSQNPSPVTDAPTSGGAR